MGRLLGAGNAGGRHRGAHCWRGSAAGQRGPRARPGQGAAKTRAPIEVHTADRTRPWAASEGCTRLHPAWKHQARELGSPDYRIGAPVPAQAFWALEASPCAERTITSVLPKAVRSVGGTNGDQVARYPNAGPWVVPALSYERGRMVLPGLSSGHMGQSRQKKFIV